MSKPVARYAVSWGLDGCYLPDSQGGTYEATTRAELADIIRGELSAFEWPKSKFSEVRIRRLWAFIKRHGSSTAHFKLCHKGYCLYFHGLTEDEYLEQNGVM